MSVEDVKRASRHLRGNLAAELAAPADTFESDSVVLLKFHGIYQQDDRDVRRARAAQKLPLSYSCMVRTSVPGGRLSAEQWLAQDRLADLADGTMRLTTRQGMQFHFVPKGSLRTVVQGRSTTPCSRPSPRAATSSATSWAARGRTSARTSSHPSSISSSPASARAPAAYWELWIDGDRAVTAEPDPAAEPEPVYGDVYLPRKFKIAVAWPGDNCVDVLANDVGIVPTLSAGTSGELTGYMVYVGGGLGMSHAREDDTYPRLGSPLGWVPPQRVVDVVEAIVTTQRDHGNREDRHRARLKYLVDERGIEWMRDEVGRRAGGPLAPPVDLPPWTAHDHHGAHDGVLGLPVPSGKVADRDGVAMRTALRELTADGTVGELRITPRQDLLLLGIAPGAHRTRSRSGCAVTA